MLTWYIIRIKNLFWFFFFFRSVICLKFYWYGSREQNVQRKLNDIALNVFVLAAIDTVVVWRSAIGVRYYTNRQTSSDPQPLNAGVLRVSAILAVRLQFEEWVVQICLFLRRGWTVLLLFIYATKSTRRIIK